MIEISSNMIKRHLGLKSIKSIKVDQKQLSLLFRTIEQFNVSQQTCFSLMISVTKLFDLQYSTIY